MLQQHLPFTVLKRHKITRLSFLNRLVATALTVYGIETTTADNTTPPTAVAPLQQHLPFTVLKPASLPSLYLLLNFSQVATALTVYGIETL